MEHVTALSGANSELCRALNTAVDC
jgi:hypothetical protein